ncbi:uncharacterized protein LOC128396479 [Panonychus citri]|uniref:Superoxide dismutase 4 n=1 Tax=Panonychus citri TaxID=50023 RepID=A0A0K0M708_PANCT|nr:uncharacterized protein LOC128396479 [Panonychus citri]AJO53613.1 superoxide dismutase 4 [Panonychus citri]
MKISFSLLILLITKILTQTTDEVIYSDEEGFERDIQPTPPPPPVPQVLPNESENNSSDPSANNVEPSRFLPIRQIYGEALIRGAPGVRGLIYFINSWNGVGIHGIVCGLRPGNHGFHIHHYGLTANGGCDAAGPHFTLYRWNHAGPTDKYRHAGDLGNLKVEQNGIAFINQFNGQVTLMAANNTILGRSIVIHEWPDDLGLGRKESNITGNVGKPIACGLIGLRRDKPYLPINCPPPNL